VPIKSDPLKPADLEKMLLPLLNRVQKEKFETLQSVDFGYGVPGVARFRANVYMQRGTVGAVFRRIPINLQTIDALELPDAIRDLTQIPDGLVLVTGPTGSGKSTALAAMISHIGDTEPLHIVTIEDPIEFLFVDKIAAISQREVGTDTPNFKEALRNAMRQDPDVIMVGEVRDAETANIAIHAALTGHLVLTTLHTETAAAAVPRLLDLGVEGFLLKSTLRAVIAQRLVRILCDRCKVKRTLGSADLAADPRYATLGLTAGETVHEPAGCERCGGTGYRGRNGVFEILELVEDVRKLVDAHTDAGTLDSAATRAGMTTMTDDAIAKCRAGITSAAEVLRVTTVR
jgi:general secretion pathway protein E